MIFFPKLKDLSPMMKYSAVSDQGDNESFSEDGTMSKSNCGNRSQHILGLGFAILLLIGVLLLSIFSTLFHRGPKWTNCGYNPDIARQRGCKYDVMIGSWLLPECYDGDLMEEYLAVRDWEFYSDPELTKVVSIDQLRLGDHDFVVYATVHQHQHHCAYVWMKQFRAAARGQKMDGLSANTHHTSHCADALYKGMPGANGSLGLEVKYFSCTEPGLGNLSRHD